MDRLDGIDEQILAELAQHARATFADIGERVNLSAPAVKRRVDRMLDGGVMPRCGPRLREHRHKSTVWQERHAMHRRSLLV